VTIAAETHATLPVKVGGTMGGRGLHEDSKPVFFTFWNTFALLELFPAPLSPSKKRT